MARKMHSKVESQGEKQTDLDSDGHLGIGVVRLVQVRVDPVVMAVHHGSLHTYIAACSKYMAC